MAYNFVAGAVCAGASVLAFASGTFGGPLNGVDPIGRRLNPPLSYKRS